jgi:hypothetical protein
MYRRLSGPLEDMAGDSKGEKHEPESRAHASSPG